MIGCVSTSIICINITFNLHYDPHHILDFLFYMPSPNNWINFNYKNYKVLHCALKVKDLVALDYHLRYRLTRTESEVVSNIVFLICRIYDNHYKIFLREITCDRERYGLEVQCKTFTIYPHCPTFSPPEHRTSPLPFNYFYR